MMMYKNNVICMIADSEIVYVDGLTIKDMNSNPTHPNVNDVFNNIENYYIISFNRDSIKGIRFLELNSKYIL